MSEPRPRRGRDATVEHFRHQARHLHSALQAGDPEASQRILRHLSRLSGSTPAQVLQADVGLQECQHVVAREAGYSGWSQLVALGTPSFEDITRLSDADIRVLLREVVPQDLAVVLMGLTEGPMSGTQYAAFGLLQQLPQAVRDDLRTQAATIKPSPEMIADAQRRIALQARMLETQGHFRKPQPSATPSVPAGLPEDLPNDLPRELDVWQSPVEKLSPENIRTGLVALALAHEEGVLEATIPAHATGYLWQAVRLVVDGTAPALLGDILETQSLTALRHVELRWRMAIDATAAIAHGDNPRLIPVKLAAIYTIDPKPQYRQVEGTIELALKRLQRTPASAMRLDEITEFYTDLAWVARVSSAAHEDGLARLAQVADALDDDIMACGLRLLGERIGRQRPVDAGLRTVIDGIITDLEAAVPPALAQVKLRYSLVSEGVHAIAEGRTAKQLSTRLDSVGVESQVRG